MRKLTLLTCVAIGAGALIAARHIFNSRERGRTGKPDGVEPRIMPGDARDIFVAGKTKSGPSG
jgi:hypothetical protein